MADSVSGLADEPAATAIEIRLSKLQQLFNSLDPSPFHEKDLDADAEEYIVGSVVEFPLQQPLKLVIHLPADQLALAESANLQDAIHNYFAYRREVARRRVRFQFREGRTALLIGLLFLVLCISIRQLVLALGHGAGWQTVSEGLLIVGWVAMWRPLEIYLYDWWPIRHHGRVFAKLATMPVELRLADVPAGR